RREHESNRHADCQTHSRFGFENCFGFRYSAIGISNFFMETIRLFRSLNRDQRNTFIACFLGWGLYAFDFFLLTFVIVPLAHDFGTSIAQLSYAITLTLAMRPVGAFIFGLLGGRFGRRIPL